MTKYSLYLNGENNYIEVPHSDSLNITESLTIEACINARRNDVIQKVVSKWEPNYYQYLLEFYGDELRFVIQVPDGVKVCHASGEVDVDMWMLIHGVYDYDVGEMLLYKNAELKATLSATGNIASQTIPVVLGARSDALDHFFKGFISFVRIYNRALSESEIKHNFENPYVPVSDGLVLWLLMDEGEGDVVYDKSGNGNDGTIYGAEWVRSPVLQWSPVKIGEVTVYPSSVKWSYEGGVRAVRFLGAECGLVYASTGKVEEEVEIEVKNKVSDSFLSDIEMLKSYIGEEVYVKFSYFPVYPMIVSSVEKREETHNMLSVFIKLKPVM